MANRLIDAKGGVRTILDICFVLIPLVSLVNMRVVPNQQRNEVNSSSGSEWASIAQRTQWNSLPTVHADHNKGGKRSAHTQQTKEEKENKKRHNTMLVCSSWSVLMVECLG